MSARPTLSSWRANAVLTALLCLVLVVLGNRAARRHLRLRVDLSEDRLFAPSEVGVRMIAGLDDVFQVRAYFTGDVKSGSVQIAKRRLMDQLEEYASLSEGRVELVYADPNGSSEAQAEAQALGMVPFTARSLRGTSVVSQDVWLGLALRHQGREAVIPFILPQSFEYEFLTAMRRLVREQDVALGFLGPPGVAGEAGPGGAEFNDLRALLGHQYRVRELLDLEAGELVPGDVAVVVVARPTNLHRRALFALDQFLQRGGRALFMIDRGLVDLAQGSWTPLETGLEPLLERLGVRVSAEVVWDQDANNPISLQRNGRATPVPFPPWPVLTAEHMDRENPATATTPAGVSMFWAHALEVESRAGIEATPLLSTSERSWSASLADAARPDPRFLSRRNSELIDAGGGGSRVVGLALRGRYASPFASGAPAPSDPIEETIHADRVRRAREEGREPPPEPQRTTDEDVQSGTHEAQLVVLGDAHLASMSERGKYFSIENKQLVLNLVDWLALEDDLLALRSRLPVERRLDDFLEEERAVLGLVGGRIDAGDALEVSQEVARLESEADARAAGRRRAKMLQATLGALGATLALGLLVRLVLVRRPRRPSATEAPR